MELLFYSSEAVRSAANYNPAATYVRNPNPCPMRRVPVVGMAQNFAQTQKDLVTGVLADNPKPLYISVQSTRFTQYFLN